MDNIFETKFAGITLDNPIVVGSSGLTNTVIKNKELEKAGAGALILKSLFEEQILNESVSLLINEDYPEAGDYIFNYLKTHKIHDYLSLIKQTKEECSIPVIASINCYKEDSWIDFTNQIEIAGADALELNLFALNTELSQELDSIEKRYEHIVQKVKETVHIPVIVKIGKYFSHLVDLVNRLHDAGADGFVLFNRFYHPDININKLQMTSGNVFSSSGDVGDVLRWTGIVTGRLPQISVASSTGIHDWEDIVKCILSGASSVQLCSTLYQNGNEIISAMKRSMEEWMHSLNFNSIEDFKGMLNYARYEDPSLYERFQFMRYFSNRD
jgi:dihydroorotate dehydrogenase (fumarate)